jgi:hypothetical protein
VCVCGVCVCVCVCVCVYRRFILTLQLFLILLRWVDKYYVTVIYFSLMLRSSELTILYTVRILIQWDDMPPIVFRVRELRIISDTFILQ